METTIKQRRSNLIRPFFLLAVLCVSVPLWFKTAVAADKLPHQTEAKIRAVLDAPELKSAHVGLSILDLGTVENAQSFPAQTPKDKPFRVLFERDADKKFMPASNMKLFTAAIVLELLGKDKTFPTTVWMHGVHGAVLRLSGGGDPSLTNNDLETLAVTIRVSGAVSNPDIISEGLAFSAETIDGKFPFGWTLDDTLWYYAPEISALAINRNQLDITVIGGEKPGDNAKVNIGPQDIARTMDVYSDVKTAGPEFSQQSFEKLLKFQFISSESGRYSIKISGQVAPGQTLTEGLAVPFPQNLATQLLAQSLSKAMFLHVFPDNRTEDQKKAGVKVRNTRRFDWAPQNSQGALVLPEPSKVIAVHNSPPLKVLFQRFLKKSDNLYAEMLLRDAAFYHDGTGGDKAGPRAHELLKKWLISQNIDIADLRFEDGSGLSRYNLLTPRATSQLLAAINRMKDGDVIWNALPIAGTDGTMKKRLTSTPALGNVRAKSGTFSIASNLSGYVTTKNNHRLAVSIYMNFPRDTDSAQKAQDEIFAILADSR